MCGHCGFSAFARAVPLLSTVKTPPRRDTFSRGTLRWASFASFAFTLAVPEAFLVNSEQSLSWRIIRRGLRHEIICAPVTSIGVVYIVHWGLLVEVRVLRDELYLLLDSASDTQIHIVLDVL